MIAIDVAHEQERQGIVIIVRATEKSYLPLDMPGAESLVRQTSKLAAHPCSDKLRRRAGRSALTIPSLWLLQAAHPVGACGRASQSHPRPGHPQNRDRPMESGQGVRTASHSHGVVALRGGTCHLARVEAASLDPCCTTPSTVNPPHFCRQS